MANLCYTISRNINSSGCTLVFIGLYMEDKAQLYFVMIGHDPTENNYYKDYGIFCNYILYVQ